MQPCGQAKHPACHGALPLNIRRALRTNSPVGLLTVSGLPSSCNKASGVRSRIPTSSYLTGFLFVVALLVAVGAFNLWSELRTNRRVDELVERALESSTLIATIRVDAQLLEEAVNAHIHAATDTEREEADDAMSFLLDEIDQARTQYIKDERIQQAALWKKLTETSRALVAPVRTAVKYSNRREAERARQHLEEKLRPVTWQLEEIATELARHNAEETKKLVREMETVRLNASLYGSGVVALAVLVALAVGWRITSRLKRQEQIIASQVDELGRRNQELDAFAHRVAHDLVSPLSPLKGYLTLVRRSPSVGDPEVKQMLLQAESSATRMAELVEALLRFCRSGRPSEGAAGELQTAVSTILLEVSQAAEAQNVVLERQLEHPLWVGCPAQLLQSIAHNLLSNAVKFAAGRPEAKVLVRAARDRGQAVLEVSDNGVGMSQESLQGLFQPFFRATGTQHVPGHGLGMATTKRLVEAHGGTIHVRSEMGAGTQVTVRLPLAPDPSVAATSQQVPA